MEAIQPYLQYFYILGGVLAFLGVALAMVRGMSGRVKGRKGGRLGISEYRELDKSRRLVLVRRDDVEHLILIGGGHDMVIESRIGAAVEAPAYSAPAHSNQFGHAQATSPPPSMVPPTNVQPMRQAPRPAIFGERRPQLRPVEPSDGQDN
jgi:hypothetical protein